MKADPKSLNRRVFRAFLATARTAVASDLAGRVKADELRSAVHDEVLRLIIARAGSEQTGCSLISDALRSDLAGRLSEIALPYDFLGAAHLDHLSTTIVFTDGKPRVVRNASRKSSGSYYTPQEVVERIVAQTLGRKLAKAESPREASRLRVLDMACGSGVFLLEAARTLTLFYSGCGMDGAETANTVAAQIYGADLSAGAAGAARLAFALAGLPEPRIFVADALRDDRFRWCDALPGIFDEGGFDVIVGNPPYAAAARLDAETKQALASRYAVYAGHGDLHYCFFERGLNLLKTGGLLGLLSSAYFLQASHAAKLRGLLAAESRIETIIDCSHEDLFPDAMIHCVITILRKEHPASGALLRFEPSGRGAFDFPQKELSGAPWVIISDAERRWRAKLEKDAVPLGEFCDIIQGPESGLNEAFVITPEAAHAEGLEAEILRPLIKNSNIGRYTISYPARLLIYVPRGTQIGRYPAIERHLKEYRNKLEARDVCRTTSAPWFEFHRPRKASRMNVCRKIVCPYRAPGNRFAVEERRALNDGGDVRMIIPKPGAQVDLYFLTAVLNSRMMERYFSDVGRRKGAMLEYFKDSLKALPIRIVRPEHPLYSVLAELSGFQHNEFSEQRDYLIERIVLDLYELKAAATGPGMLF